MSNNIRIAVAKGDGIGPEIMDAVLRILKAANAPLSFEEVDMGKPVFLQGHSTGMTPEAKEIIEDCGILLKGPMETPKGRGMKSINVTARKVWNTYANVRRFKSLEGVDTVYSRAGIPIDMTVMRENIEDTYSGIEYQPSTDIATGLRFISRAGSEQLFRKTFEIARQEGTKRVTCGHKANIMKMTDGLFLETFYKVAEEFPDIEANDAIVDDLAMKLVMQPQNYQMIVMTNLQGDILSDLCAGLVGGLGFAPSANIGDKVAIFEAVHGTAPDIAGQKKANPTSLLLSSLMMLGRLGHAKIADQVENSLLYCLEQGVHTADFGPQNVPACDTDTFADKIIENLGQKPEKTTPKSTPGQDKAFVKPEKPSRQRLLSYPNRNRGIIEGIDIFISFDGLSDELATEVQNQLPESVELETISNRGTQVWPESSVFTECVPHYRVRIMLRDQSAGQKELMKVLQKLSESFDISETYWLRSFGEHKGYSLAQGQ